MGHLLDDRYIAVKVEEFVRTKTAGYLWAGFAVLVVLGLLDLFMWFLVWLTGA